jgi:PEGA domain-containing protein
MDYLDPQKQFRHRVIMMVGYVCIAIGITIATIILLYLAYGFGVGKNGAVIQNGLVFFSSQPNPATIQGLPSKAQTNNRLLLPEGIYNVTLSRPGYRNWQRSIEVDGGTVEHFDYPFLFPASLKTQKLDTYASAPALMTQSPDRRWLLIQEPATATLTFDEYDLTNTANLSVPTKASIDIALPAGIATAATSSESWQVIDWADDNQHVLLQHNYDDKSEFILLDRSNPAQSINLDTSLSANPTKLTFDNKKYNQYYLYDATSDTLSTASLAAPASVADQPRVLAYQTYGANTVLYATDAGAPAGKVQINLAVGSQVYPIRSLPAGTTYLLDLTEYNGTLYVAAGATSDNKVYIYKDPIGQLSAMPNHALLPAQVLRLTAPNYVSFSTTAQFIMAENATNFGVYDIENLHGYSYTSPLPVDAPQSHANWMDGDRLFYVSSGKLVVFDYDGSNRQTLMNAGSGWAAAFAPDYKYVYELVPNQTAAGQFNLDQTALLTPTDL